MSSRSPHALASPAPPVPRASRTTSEHTQRSATGDRDDTAEKVWLSRSRSAANLRLDLTWPLEPLKNFPATRIKTFSVSRRGRVVALPLRARHTVAHGAHPARYQARVTARVAARRTDLHATLSPKETRAEVFPLGADLLLLDGTSSRPKPCTSRRCASMGSSPTRSARSCPRSTPCSTPSPA